MDPAALIGWRCSLANYKHYNESQTKKTRLELKLQRNMSNFGMKTAVEGTVHVMPICILQNSPGIRQLVCEVGELRSYLCFNE